MILFIFKELIINIIIKWISSKAFEIDHQVQNDLPLYR